MKKQNDWLWNTGSIFILLSVAALWALVQVGETSLRVGFYWILASFSIATIFIWLVTIVRSARKWSKVSREVATEIEAELKETFCFTKSLLHTRIQERDKNRVITGYIGIWFFVILILVVWIITGVVVGTIRFHFA